mgnify:CR=1 FL=1
MNNSKKNINGVVLSNKMNKTLVVKVERKVKHRKYKKIIKRYTKFFVHDENNECKIGDLISFKEVAPISKKKNWILSRINKIGQKHDTNAI